MTKAQIAYEFLIVSFFLTLGFTVWILFSAEAQQDLKREQTILQINDLGFQIQQDLYTTIQEPEGFKRTIELPATLQGEDYVITIKTYDDQNFLILTAGRQITELPIPPTDGMLVQGENHLEVIDETIRLTQ